MVMMKRMQFGWMAMGLMGLAMVPTTVPKAWAQKTTVKESSTSSSRVTVTSGGQGGTSSTVKDDLFAGTEVFAKGASDVTEITMDPGTLGMVGGKESKRAHTMVLNVVRTYEYDKPGMYKIEDVEVFRNKLNTGEWHCSVHTRSLKTGESTDVCNRQRTDGLKESAIITVEPKSLTFIHTIRKGGDGESEVGWMPLRLSVPDAEVAELRAEMPGMIAEGQALKGETASLQALNGNALLLKVPNNAETLRMMDADGLSGKAMELHDLQKQLEPLQKTGPVPEGTPQSFLLSIPDGATVSTDDGVVKALPDGKLEVHVPETPEAKALLDSAKEQGRAVPLEELQKLSTPDAVGQPK